MCRLPEKYTWFNKELDDDLHTSVVEFPSYTFISKPIQCVINKRNNMYTILNFHVHLYHLVRMESSAYCPVSREAGTCSTPKFESTWGVSKNINFTLYSVLMVE